MEKNTICILSAEDLEAAIRKIVNDPRETSNDGVEEHLSIKDVISRLDVSRTTLWRWEKSGYLTPVRVGNKVRYKASDINKLFHL